MTRWRHPLIGPLLGALLWLGLGTCGLLPEARNLAGVMACVVFWWVAESLPLAVSALLGSCACVLLGVAPARKVFAAYGDPVIMLFLGSFWLAKAMARHGLDRRIALRLLSVPSLNRSPAALMTGLAAAAAMVSAWVSNTAATAMLLPVVLGMLSAIPAESRDPRFESRLLLMLAFAASLGGLATPVGTPPNLIGMGMLERLAGIHLSFFAWMKLGVPLAVVSLAFAVLLLCRRLDAPPGWGGLRRYLDEERARIGPWTRGEKATAMALSLAVVLWLFAGEAVPEGVAALLAASLLFVLRDGHGAPALTWDAACGIDWGVLLLFGGGMSLGGLLFDTKLADSLGQALASLLGVRSPFGTAGVSAGLALVTSELSSNTASANVAVPTALALAKTTGAAPSYPALAATLAASFGFLLPVSTPPNALVYGTGKVRLRDMMRFGLVLDVFGFVLIWFGLGVLGV
ncbi:MAG: SLC13/DASS family transporter [Elusimicrobia bacterium]|nr:SLC13/DASS family transporter [Elusimicrobiota bacterium]